ncbi:phage tail protein [Acidisoma sp. 7E03]
MSDAYLGEIRLVSYPAGKVPRDWLPCDGRIMEIQRNAPLYALLGTAYGGDGRTTFALPDLRGRVPMAASDAQPRGTRGGTEMVTLDANTMPAHTHLMQVSTNSANQTNTANHIYAAAPSNVPVYGDAENPIQLGETDPQLKQSGGGQGHENRQPYLALTYIICISGIFPPRP